MTCALDADCGSYGDGFCCATLEYENDDGGDLNVTMCMNRDLLEQNNGNIKYLDQYVDAHCSSGVIL